MCMPPVKTTITCLSSSSSEDVQIIDNENMCHGMFEVSMQQILYHGSQKHQRIAMPVFIIDL